jgi:hypothetical protein
VCVCVWQITDLPVKTALIETLSTVTAGKIYVEVERARLVRQLAKIKEAAGDIDAAAEAMQEVAVRPRRPRQASGAVCMCVRVSTLLLMLLHLPGSPPHFAFHRWRRLVRWPRRRRWRSFWNKCGCAWTKRTSCAPRSSPRKLARAPSWRGVRAFGAPAVTDALECTVAHSHNLRLCFKATQLARKARLAL